LVLEARWVSLKPKKGYRSGYPVAILTGFEEARAFPADTAEYVAQRILEGIESWEAEIFAAH